MSFRLTISRFADHAFYAGVLLLASSLPISIFAQSLAQFILAGAWILQGNYKVKFFKTIRQPVVLILWGVYAMLLIGLWNTVDMNAALVSLRVKLPLFLMPFLLSSMTPLTAKQYRTVLSFLVHATLISTLISFAVYLGWYGPPIHDIRDISIFISHIRLSLLICLSIAACIWLIKGNTSIQLRFYLIAVIIWFTYFLFILQSGTGLTILFSGFFIILAITGYRSKYSFVRLSVLVIVIGLIALAGGLIKYIFIDSTKTIVVNPQTLHQTTRYGHPYQHRLNLQDAENVNLVWINYCEFEIDSAFKSRTGTSLFDSDKHQQMILMTLMRYMTSKNLIKDADGVASMSDAELKAVLNGVSNFHDLKSRGISKRVRDIAWEYRCYYFNGNPSGHSLTMRFEFWKTGWFILKKNLITGIGTGDVEVEYAKAYEELNSKLDKKWRFTSHNQYLLIALLFGIPGLLYFLFSIFFPYFYLVKKYDFMYCCFIFIFLCSMLNEDTLETATGVTFYAFFNALLLFNDSRFKEISSLKFNNAH